MTSRRIALGALGAAALAACIWGVSGTPGVTLRNTGLRLEHSPARAAWGLAGCAGLAVLVAATPRRTLRISLAAAALLAAAMSAQRLAYRLDAGPEALVARDLFGGSALPWRDVERVEIEADQLIVQGRDEATIRVATAHLHPDVRATLERLISRRVAETKTGAR